MRPWGGGSAVGLLRVLLVSSVAVPLTLFGLDAWFSHRKILEDVARDAARVCEVAQEHAAKVFNSHELVARRVGDLLAGRTDDDVRRSEHAVHDAMVDMVAGLPQVESFVVLDREARLLAATAAYPVSRTTDFSDRDYFMALKAGFADSFLSKLQVSRVDGRVFFGLGRRLQTPDGAFRGVVDIAVSPPFFMRFWETVVGEEGAEAMGKAVALVRQDGATLTLWPFPDGTPFSSPAAFLDATQRSPDAGVFTGPAFLAGHSGTWAYVYRKVQGYPVYTVVGRSDAAVAAVWWRRMATDLAIFVPTTLALWLITWTALQRTRREEAALVRLRAEMQRREAAEAALLQAQRMEAVGQLTGGVAHDFNNLLTIMLGNFEMIGRTPEWRDRTVRLARAGVSAAQRGAELTAKLLAFSRRRMIRAEVVDVNHLLEEFRPVLRQGVTAAAALVFELGAGQLPAALDPGQLEAAVLNLVANARDAMPGSGTILVQTEAVTLAAGDLVDQPDAASGAYVRVAVADDGAGMEQAVASRAFEPFFTTKEAGRGTGLGLSQVYGFCKQAGGFARIRSAPGQGTTVELLLPRARDLPQARPATMPPGDIRPVAGQVVLVVEDDAAVLDVAAAHLDELGYVTRTAVDAAEALEVLAAGPRVDILFSDIVLPGGMDGVQLAEAARRLRPGLRVLLASGYADPGPERAVPDHAVLLAKPYTRDDLGAALAAGCP